MGYLRFPMERRLDDFPSMQEYIQKPYKMEKNVYLDTKNSDTIYNNLPKLIQSAGSFKRRICVTAEMVKLVDTRDLKSIVPHF